MSKMTSNFEIKKSNIAIGVGVLFTIAAGIGIYVKRQDIKNYFNNEETIVDGDEAIVNDVSDEVIVEESNNSESINKSTPVPLTKGKTILDTLVEENEKLRIKEDTESAEVDE